MVRPLWERWKVIAHKIGTVQSRVLMNIFSCVILAPFGLGVKRCADRLRLKQQNPSHWLPKERHPLPARERARRQY